MDNVRDGPASAELPDHDQGLEAARGRAGRLSADGRRDCRNPRIHMSNWLRRVWHLLNRSRREQELVCEMREHRDAMHDSSKFGDTHRLLEQSRDAWGWNWLDDAMQDLTVGIRALLKSPSFAITATLILTFGIGLNLTLFQMIRVGMLNPPPLKNADSWVRFSRATPHSRTSTVPYPLTQFVRGANNGVLASVVVEYQSGMGWGRDGQEQV